MFEVIYYSMTGHTKKIAEAIAEELKVAAQDVKRNAEMSKDSLLLLGSGSYGGRPGKELMGFIESNDFKGRKVAIFGTSASPHGEEIQEMEAALKAKGAVIAGKFNCEGRFLFFNLGHPNAKDLENARRFAQEMKNL